MKYEKQNIYDELFALMIERESEKNLNRFFDCYEKKAAGVKVNFSKAHKKAVNEILENPYTETAETLEEERPIHIRLNRRLLIAAIIIFISAGSAVAINGTRMKFHDYYMNVTP